MQRRAKLIEVRPLDRTMPDAEWAQGLIKRYMAWKLIRSHMSLSLIEAPAVIVTELDEGNIRIDVYHTEDNPGPQTVYKGASSKLRTAPGMGVTYEVIEDDWRHDLSC